MSLVSLCLSSSFSMMSSPRLMWYLLRMLITVSGIKTLSLSLWNIVKTTFVQCYHLSSFLISMIIRSMLRSDTDPILSVTTCFTSSDSPCSDDIFFLLNCIDFLIILLVFWWVSVGLRVTLLPGCDGFLLAADCFWWPTVSDDAGYSGWVTDIRGSWRIDSWWCLESWWSGSFDLNYVTIRLIYFNNSHDLLSILLRWFCCCKITSLLPPTIFTSKLGACTGLILFPNSSMSGMKINYDRINASLLDSLYYVVADTLQLSSLIPCISMSVVSTPVFQLIINRK